MNTGPDSSINTSDSGRACRWARAELGGQDAIELATREQAGLVVEDILCLDQGLALGDRAAQYKHETEQGDQCGHQQRDPQRFGLTRARIVERRGLALSTSATNPSWMNAAGRGKVVGGEHDDEREQDEHRAAGGVGGFRERADRQRHQEQREAEGPFRQPLPRHQQTSPAITAAEATTVRIAATSTPVECSGPMVAIAPNSAMAAAMAAPMRPMV